MFVDIGSGKGLIAAAAVGQGGYARAVGIEKYRDKYEDSIKLRSSLPEDVQSRLEFISSDVADLDLRELMQLWAQAEVMFFCNNLAFGQGMNGRYAWPCSRFSPSPGKFCGPLKSNLLSSLRHVGDKTRQDIERVQSKF